jgi:hypothetical protein
VTANDAATPGRYPAAVSVAICTRQQGLPLPPPRVRCRPGKTRIPDRPSAGGALPIPRSAHCGKPSRSSTPESMRTVKDGRKHPSTAYDVRRRASRDRVDWSLAVDGAFCDCDWRKWAVASVFRSGSNQVLERCHNVCLPNKVPPPCRTSPQQRSPAVGAVERRDSATDLRGCARRRSRCI